MRYRLTIAYDGAEFVGWQKQEPPAEGSIPDAVTGERERAPLRSVQGVVEQAVREVVRQPIVLIGASRTDSGVHARHQTAAFTMRDQTRDDGRRIGPPDDRMMEAINSRLPPDVLITRCEPADPAFDPIKDCLCKGYRYTVWPQRDRPLWERNWVWHVRQSLDVEAMAAAAPAMVGRHDFASFAAAGHGRESTVRQVLQCAVRAQGERIEIDVAADGFLWNMVRIIAGTLVEVGRGKIAPDDIPGIIASLDRTRAGPTAPATGLCLMWGLYPGDALPAGVEIDRAFLVERSERVLAVRAARQQAWLAQQATVAAQDAAGDSSGGGAR